MNIKFHHPLAPTVIFHGNSAPSQVGILNHLMGAGGPHWCEDPVVDRENEVVLGWMGSRVTKCRGELGPEAGWKPQRG